MQVTLIGDSIRRSYQPYVQKELSEQAIVWGPEENCRSSEYILMQIMEWILYKDQKIIHLNSGLHDILKPIKGSGNAISLDQYSSNVEKILKIAIEKTRARVIWATTTPVIKNRHNRLYIGERKESDVLEYNKSAVNVARSLNVEINDLHQIVTQAGCERMLTSDGVHFTKLGQLTLGKAVADSITRCQTS